MTFKFSVGKIILLLHAFPFPSICQLHTTGYAYELISGPKNETPLSSELLTAYHDCWVKDSCKYVAQIKKTGEYVMLKLGEELGNKAFYSIWKKRVEGKICHYLCC